MNIEKLEASIQSLVANLSEQSFIYDLLLAYDQPKSSITRLQKGDYNLSKNQGEILWKKKLFYKVEAVADLHGLIDKLKSDPAITRHHPRFIIVTDYQTLLAVDTKIDDTLDIPVQELAKHFDFFLPWAGMEKSQIQSEKLADIKAAERMGRLYDLILEDNPVENEAERHSLNIFLSRLLFCFFAEDTGIFKDDQFTNDLASHTSDDGSDLQAYLQKLFTVLNLRERDEYPKYLQAFPYVNGGLFADDHPVPKFSVKSRKIILECGALNWKAINPDIFGSMMQAVVHTEQRSSLGMHYTSVVNIMKVIEPLFLNELNEELEKAANNEKKLTKLLDRLYHLRIFDPACGSGNFLIISYKELCKIEIDVYRRLNAIRKSGGLILKSNLRLSQFYGIELDDFAHESAKLSLWLAEHQMNLAFKEVFGDARPTLPLRDSGHIVCENATKINWVDVCPNDSAGEVFIFGNPPYLGFNERNKKQKEDMEFVFEGIGKVKRLDYIGCWFKKASDYIKRLTSSRYAFVTTNSICQGEQVSLIWPYVFSCGLEIYFAYETFKWANNAKSNAGVSCNIIGVQNIKKNEKYIISGSAKRLVSKINPYLVEGSSVIMEQRKKPISGFPEMALGSSGIDGGNLILSRGDKDKLVEANRGCIKFIHPFLGGGDFLKGTERFCLWIDDDKIEEARLIKEIDERIEKCKKYRLTAGRDAKKAANVPHRFFYRKYRDGDAIIFPMTSSERREYIPVGYIKSGTIVSNGVFVIYDTDPLIFGILSSRFHMVWIHALAGKLESRIRYSVNLNYNTFPFPEVTSQRKESIIQCVYRILDEREVHSEKTIAELYDPDKMPEGLRMAHHEMDLAVEQCYRARPFKTDEERLEYLFKLYEEMTAAEGKQGK